mmetsp:Transcript_22390/g.51296  ORF Transcript_22390/g.51296 Transcript_22390/m.51296 type:complete len:291 (-) Transcript_22390:145-1017(-)
MVVRLNWFRKSKSLYEIPEVPATESNCSEKAVVLAGLEKSSACQFWEGSSVGIRTYADLQKTRIIKQENEEQEILKPRLRPRNQTQSFNSFGVADRRFTKKPQDLIDAKIKQENEEEIVLQPCLRPRNQTQPFKSFSVSDRSFIMASKDFLAPDRLAIISGGEAYTYEIKEKLTEETIFSSESICTENSDEIECPTNGKEMINQRPHDKLYSRAQQHHSIRRMSEADLESYEVDSIFSGESEFTDEESRDQEYALATFPRSNKQQRFADFHVTNAKQVHFNPKVNYSGIN